MGDSEAEKRKCVDCGYLAARRKKGDGLVESPLEQRQEMTYPSAGTENITHFLCPVCFKNEKQFVAFQPSLETASRSEADKIRKFLQEDRECESYTDLIRGLSPKEHLAMSLLTDWDAERRAWLKEQREDSVNSLAEQRASNEKLLDRQLIENRKIADSARINAYVCAGIGALAVVVGAALAWYFTYTTMKN